MREVLLHVITETATHAGHLDAARELLDGRTWMGPDDTRVARGRGSAAARYPSVPGPLRWPASRTACRSASRRARMAGWLAAPARTPVVRRR